MTIEEAAPMPGAWVINVEGRRYGPFSSERMRSFVAEGRLAAQSLVAPEGSDDWHEARDEPEFRDLFPMRAEANAAVASMMMAATNAAAPATAAPADVSAPPATPAANSPASPETTEVNRAHFAVVIDRKGQGHSRGNNLEEAISSLGPWYQLLPNVWIISTEHTVNSVRNRLLQELGKSDSLFVIDASRGKAAWFNFGPEADARIRRVWQKAS
jgi:hypothetical protein